MRTESSTEARLRIAVVGAGAIGGLIAGRLCQTGQAVSLLARGQTLSALRASGLTIEDSQTGQTCESKPAFCANPAEAGIQDFVIVAVKSYGLADVIKGLQPMLDEHTRIVTAVNGIPWWFTSGLGHGELSLASLDLDQALSRAAPAQRIIGCVVNCAASVPRPAVIRHAGGNRLTLGSPLRGDETETRVLAAALTNAGFDASVSDFIQREYWKKLLGNITLNTIGALTLSDTRQMLDDADAAELILQVMREVNSLGKAIGIDIGISAEERLQMARRLGHFRSSMLQDLEASKPLEIDGLFAAVIDLAGQTGTAIPNTRTLHTLARLRARATQQYPMAATTG